MDKDILVSSLKQAFKDTEQYNVEVDAFMLALAFPNFIRNSYILGVSVSSSLKDDYLISGRIVDILFDRMTKEERIHIDRVRIYHSIDELKKNYLTGFDSYEIDNFQYLPDTGQLELVAA